MIILHIDSSIRGDKSVSRKLSGEIVARQKALHPDATIVYRDLVRDAALHLSDRHLAVLHAGAVADPLLGADIGTGGAYIDEMFAADIIVLGAPMYNFSIPSQLKGWIDRVVIAGRTFKYEAGAYEGLLKGKKLFIASSRGGFYAGDSPMAALDHHETYLTGILGFVGLTDVTIIRAEGIALGEDATNAAVAKAELQIAALAA